LKFVIDLDDLLNEYTEDITEVGNFRQVHSTGQTSW